MQIWPAPAKLNLFLHVIGRRDDGYHLLQTAFQFLDYGDELQYAVTDDGYISSDTNVPGLAPESDLCVCAARLLQSESGCKKGVTIKNKKVLPMGGGLGGGSSDAATTLMALNQLWQLHLSPQRLATLALSLGADVPVFVGRHASWAEGIGEQLTPIDPPENWIVVLVPSVAISTADIFHDPELTRNSRPITIRDFHDCLAQNRCRNDLEVVVRKRFPAVDQLMNGLAAFGSPQLTGSGACVFMTVADRQAGQAILQQLAPAASGFVARGMNVHPIAAMLDAS